MEKHFVTFYSPGTFVSESTQKPIDSWDVQVAKKMAAEINERNGATPYGFRFTTRGRSNDELDSQVIQSSPMYYLGGVVETLTQVEARNDPSESILRSNMRCNGYNRIITNRNSWKFTAPLQDDDVVLDWDHRTARTEAK